MKNIRLWLSLINKPGIGVVNLKKIYLKSERIENLNETLKITGIKVDLINEKFFEKVEQANVRILTIFDSEYPQLLREIADPPAVLFCKGNVELLKRKSVAIVGTRKFSNYGRNLTILVVKEFDECVVSGMAFGIDGIAHETAINNKISTIAVLPSGVNNPYPRSHSYLYDKIFKSNNLLISENFNIPYPKKYNFVARNRIIAGLAERLVLIEAPIKSGALISANLAFDYNRRVLVCPARLNEKSFHGNLNFIKQLKGEIYFPNNDRSKKKKLKGKEQQIVELIQCGNSTFEQLLANGKLNFNDLLASLMDLEIQQIIFKSNNGKYQLK